MPARRGDLIPEKQILKIIMVVRGEKVILDSDLARLYGVETRRLNEQVRRNIEKFPDDFMFQLTKEEFENLKSQIATSSSGWGGRGTGGRGRRSEIRGQKDIRTDGQKLGRYEFRNIIQKLGS